MKEQLETASIYSKFVLGDCKRAHKMAIGYRLNLGKHILRHTAIIKDKSI
jgi:hypothetical protein